MDKDNFNTLIQQIGACEDEVQRRELLATLSDDVSPIFDNVNNLTEQNRSLSEDNEALRSANMKLFLRVGNKTEEDIPPKEEKKEKLKFENLFNEKGGIK